MPQTILIVEDDNAFANLITRAVTGAGYECVRASDGAKALEAVRKHKPELILLDLLMPKKDGRAVLAALQSKEGTRDIPVVAMSGVFRGRSTARELQDAGAEGFLEKPFSTNDLVAHLHALIGPPQDEKSKQQRETVSLADRTVVEVLWQVMTESFSGAVHFGSGKLQKVLVFKEGAPVLVRSNSARECLGRRLLQSGKISKAALEESLSRGKADGVRQGEALVAMGVIGEEEVEHELRAQVEDKLLDPFTWNEGEAWRQPGVERISYASEVQGWTPRGVVFHGAGRMSLQRAATRLQPLIEARVSLHTGSISPEERSIPHIRHAITAMSDEVLVGDLLESHARALLALWVTGAARVIEPGREAPTLVPAAFLTGTQGDADQDAGGQPTALARVRKLQQTLEGKSHFEILGLDPAATRSDVRAAYLKLAKLYHPDRFSGESDEVRNLAASTFALITTAHDTLSDTEQRREYQKRLKRGTTEEQDRAHVQRFVSAEQKFSEGEAMYKGRAYQRALQLFAEARELAPDEAEYHAYYGWTHYLVNKGADGAAREAAQHVDHAISLAENSPTGYYFRGQLHKACAEPELARRMFKTVLELRPNHVEAARELRLIEMRKSKQSGGLFGRGRKKK